MNREIKFRGKIAGAYIGNDPQNNWFYGSLVKELSTGKTYILDVAYTDKGEARFNTLGLEVYPNTVGQFTGLHDKNGVEIYEGDVLCYKDEKYEDGIIGWEVFYEDGSFMASLTDGKDTFGGDFQLQEYAISDKLYCEVIGNIHDKEKMK